ncbi:hypothetical protein Tco_0490073 [Tanacetum coccineum]
MSTEIKLTKDDEADSVDSSKYQDSLYDHRNSDIKVLLKWPSIKVKELQEQINQAFKIKKGMSMPVRKTQDHKTEKRPQVDDQRLDLADDLTEAQVHISSTITSHKTKTTTSLNKILHEESKDYELNTRSRLLSLS